MKQRIRSMVRENRSLVLFIVLMAVFRSSLADWNSVPTGSMKPTIIEGDRILVNKLAYDLKLPLINKSIYRIAEPKRGDIVIFDSKVADKRLVKRVVGLPGDVVALKDNQLVINGAASTYSGIDAKRDVISAVETYGNSSHAIQLAPGSSGGLRSFEPVEIPDDHYLVLGDNRDNSADSRVIGFVPRKEIIGRSQMVVLSVNYDNYYLPRADRFLHKL
jgi:signal peptidase I